MHLLFKRKYIKCDKDYLNEKSNVAPVRIDSW